MLVEIYNMRGSTSKFFHKGIKIFSKKKKNEEGHLANLNSSCMSAEPLAIIIKLCLLEGTKSLAFETIVAILPNCKI